MLVRGREGEWRDPSAALEEENRCLKEGAAAEAAHKRETLGRFEELQRRMDVATVEIAAMRPNMEVREAVALEFAQIAELPWLARHVEFPGTRERTREPVPKALD
jgi:hypothetical protein